MFFSYPSQVFFIFFGFYQFKTENCPFFACYVSSTPHSEPNIPHLSHPSSNIHYPTSNIQHPNFIPTFAPMLFFKRVFHFLYIIYALAILLILVVVLFFLVILTIFLPTHKRGNAVYFLARVGVRIGMLLWGIRHKNIFEHPHDSSRPSVFVFNHISYIDALVILMAVRKQRIRGLGKFEISKIPLFGYIYSSAVIMVKRDSAEDRARSVQDLKQAIADNISIILAPEGTFNMTDAPLMRFYDGAFKVAIETQTPIKPLLFLDTYDRLHYGSAFSLTPGKSRVVFLQEVSVEGYTMEDVSLLRQKVYDQMQEALIRYKASWIGNC